jgi:hypothetical protein
MEDDAGQARLAQRTLQRAGYAAEAMKLGAGDYVVKDIDGLYLTLLPTVVARVLHQQRLRALPP